jgi:hypothetical protein
MTNFSATHAALATALIGIGWHDVQPVPTCADAPATGENRWKPPANSAIHCRS